MTLILLIASLSRECSEGKPQNCNCENCALFMTLQAQLDEIKQLRDEIIA
jgi:hypothetical protein